MDGMTEQARQCAAALYRRRTRPISGAEIVRKMGLTGGRRGLVYQILKRFREKGIVTRVLEDGEASKLGRPKQWLYTLTPAGKTYVGAVLKIKSSPKGVTGESPR